MSTITAILQPEPDGTVRLPLPAELRGGPVKIEAKVEPAPELKQKRAKPGIWKELGVTFHMSDDFDAPLEDFREYME